MRFKIKFIQSVHHSEEILYIWHICVRKIKTSPNSMSIGICCESRDSANDAVNLFISSLFIVINGVAREWRILIGVAGGHCCHGWYEHSHGVGVVTERFHHSFDIAVNHAVSHYSKYLIDFFLPILPFGKLICSWQFSVYQ